MAYLRTREQGNAMVRGGTLPPVSRKESSNARMVKRGAQVVDVVADQCPEDRVGMLDRPEAPSDVLVRRLVELAYTGDGLGVPIEIASNLVVQKLEVLLSTP